MEKHPFFYVKKHVLLAIAGCVWLIAGFNVARLRIIAYEEILQIKPYYIVLSLAVFCAFGLMFFSMSFKHKKRINGYEEDYRPFWNFFDLKAYVIMIVMIGGGIGLRYSGLIPDECVAMFYTGLGCALSLAGILFWIMFFMSLKKAN